MYPTVSRRISAPNPHQKGIRDFLFSNGVREAEGGIPLVAHGRAQVNGQNLAVEAAGPVVGRPGPPYHERPPKPPGQTTKGGCWNGEGMPGPRRKSPPRVEDTVWDQE
jgi:hypothetical protein